MKCVFPVALFCSGFLSATIAIARDYDPVAARYLQGDPIGLRGGPHGYAYVNNSPLRYIDPFGLAPGDVFVTLDGAAGDAGNFSRKKCLGGFECGGWIFRKKNGFTYNFIQAKKHPSKLTHEEMNSCKPDTPHAGWHKHPWFPDVSAPDDDTDINHFSQGDKDWVNINKLPLYLNAPSEVNRVLEPQKGERVLK